MKKLLFMVGLVVFLCSCEKDQLVYSCDPEIDAIVKSASAEFAEISLSEFLEYDMVLQRAIYRSFSDEKKMSFWMEKMDYILLFNNYNLDEYRHVEELKRYLKTKSFDLLETDTVLQNETLLFISEWENDVEKSFGWERKDIRYILYSLCLTKDQYSSSIIEFRSTTLKSLSTSCDCASEVDCDDVGLGFICESGSCDSSGGCGPFWVTKCTGTCQ